MIGFIFICLLAILISGMLGCIPFVIWMILIEMDGLSDYMWALGYLTLAVVELIIFINYLFGTQYSFNIKDIFKKIKSLFKKKKENKGKNNKNKFKKTAKTNVSIDIIELIILIIFIVVSLFLNPHSLALNVIYHNPIIKIIYVICIPLIIINLINEIREGNYGGVISTIIDKFFMTFITFIIGVAIWATILVVAESQEPYNYISDNIQSLFVYDRKDYDAVRKEINLISEYDFLKDNLQTSYNSLTEQNNINTEEGYNNIKNNLITNSSIGKYGYIMTDFVWQSDDIELVCILDKKTKKYNIYKITYHEFSFNESTDQEFTNAKKNK